MGHLEYSPTTLDTEYRRDLGRGLDIDMPENYYVDNNPDKGPDYSWREPADAFYSNWLNYYVNKKLQATQREASSFFLLPAMPTRE